MIDRKELRRKRIELCISQAQLGKIAGVSYRTIVRFENGEKIRKTSLDKIVRAMRRIERSPKNENLWWKSHKNDLLEKLEKI